MKNQNDKYCANCSNYIPNPLKHSCVVNETNGNFDCKEYLDKKDVKIYDCHVLTNNKTMKTKLCRLVLAKSNKEHIGKGLYFVTSKSTGKEVLEYMYYGHNPQQLFLISLDPDEKIEVGDTVYKINHSHTTLFKVDSEELADDYNKNKHNYKKVIATQEQLPETYIQKFIKEYDNGDVKDIQIEMDCYKQVIISNDRKTPNGTEYKEIEYDLICKPKLINGFVSIIEEENTSLPDVSVAKFPLPRPLEAWNAARTMDFDDYCEWHLAQEKRGYI